VVGRGFCASSRLHLAAEPFLLRIRLTRGSLKAAPRVWHNQEILYEADFFLNGNLAELERLAAEVSCFRAANSLSVSRHAGHDGVRSWYYLSLSLE
jgi:hypothetical protein